MITPTTIYACRGITPYMVVKHRTKNGRVYLEEYKSIRVNGKVKSVYVRSIGPEKPVNKNKTKRKTLDKLEPSPSHRAGDVTLLWKLAQDLDIAKTIDDICCENTNIEGLSPGKLITAWAINRVLDPESATKLERWVPKTDLPRLMGINPADFTKNAFLTALDFICYSDKWIDGIQDNSPKIENSLYRKWRELYPLDQGEKEILAYDITTILFFGVSCPLAELGYNPNGIKRVQANIALIVSRKDKYPLLHIIHNGSRNGTATIKNLISNLQESNIEEGTLIWDRGNVSRENVISAENANWKIICGVPKTSKAVKDILKNTDLKCSWNSLIRSSKAGHIYATGISDKLYGKERKLTIYTNREKGIKDANSRNEALSSIESGLIELKEEGSNWSEKKLHAEIKKIIGEYGRFVTATVSRKGNGPRIKWKFNNREINETEMMDGKYMLLSTDASLSPKEIVNIYLEKDFIEKVFRTLKTTEQIEPVRHRLEERVRAYIFVCVLAYRLLAYLQYRLGMISKKEDTWEGADSLLSELERVERVQVKLGHQVKTWYLNLQKKTSKTLDEMGIEDLFIEKTEVDFRYVGGN